MPECSAGNRKSRSLRNLAFGAIALAALMPGGAAFAACGAGAPSGADTKCVDAIPIKNTTGFCNGKASTAAVCPLRSFDIAFVNPFLGRLFLADRTTAGVDIINTDNNTFLRTIPGFTGVVLNSKGNVVFDISGPAGVVNHGIWVYAGDGDSTLKVIDLRKPTASAIVQTIATGDKSMKRVDEMALNFNGSLLLAANNAADPPFATLLRANGNSAGASNVQIIGKITVDPAIIPAGAGLSLEQPAWERETQRFYTSIPVIANNPAGCNFDESKGKITCDGGLLVLDPKRVTGPTVLGAFDSKTNTGVVPLHACGPNGATVGPRSNLLLGCTPRNNPSNTTTLVINARSIFNNPPTGNYANIANITGSDEVWFNSGDRRYYTGSSADIGSTGKTVPALGVIDSTSVLIEKIPQGSGAHTVAADCARNRIYVPQTAPSSVVGSGGDTTGVSAKICGSTNGCVAVYHHRNPNPDCQLRRASLRP